jgi:hypothetical protein
MPLVQHTCRLGPPPPPPSPPPAVGSSCIDSCNARPSTPAMTPPCHRTHPLVRAHPDSTHTAPPPSLSHSPSAQARPCKRMSQSVSCSPGPRSARRPPPADTSTPHADVVKARSHRRPGEMPPEQSTTRACDQATCARGPLAVSRRPRLSCARPQPPTRISDPAGHARSHGSRCTAPTQMHGRAGPATIQGLGGG